MYSVLNTLDTFTCQKSLLHTLLLLVFKIVESLQCILNIEYFKIRKNSKSHRGARVGATSLKFEKLSPLDALKIHFRGFFVLN